LLEIIIYNLDIFRVVIAPQLAGQSISLLNFNTEFFFFHNIIHIPASNFWIAPQVAGQ